MAWMAGGCDGVRMAKLCRGSESYPMSVKKRGGMAGTGVWVGNKSTVTASVHHSATHSRVEKNNRYILESCCTRLKPLHPNRYGCDNKNPLAMQGYLWFEKIENEKKRHANDVSNRWGCDGMTWRIIRQNENQLPGRTALFRVCRNVTASLAFSKSIAKADMLTTI